MHNLASNEVNEVLVDSFEEVGFARAEEAKGLTRTPDKWPQQPAHLRADQGKGRHPAAENQLYLPPADMGFSFIKRAYDGRVVSR